MMIFEHGDRYDLQNVSMEELAAIYRALCVEESIMPERAVSQIRADIKAWLELVLEQQMKKTEKKTR